MTRAEGVWIWLSRVRGLGAGRARQLVEFFGGEEALLAAQEPELREAVGEALAVSLLEARRQEEINDHVRACRRAGVRILTPARPDTMVRPARARAGRRSCRATGCWRRSPARRW